MYFEISETLRRDTYAIPPLRTIVSSLVHQKKQEQGTLQSISGLMRNSAKKHVIFDALTVNQNLHTLKNIFPNVNKDLATVPNSFEALLLFFARIRPQALTKHLHKKNSCAQIHFPLLYNVPVNVMNTSREPLHYFLKHYK